MSLDGVQDCLHGQIWHLTPLDDGRGGETIGASYGRP